MAKKHKEIKRWAAGVEMWSDTLVTVHATLIETPKQFRLKKEGRDLGSTERLFSRFTGFHTLWSKEVYSEVGHATEGAALKAYQADLIDQVEQAQKVMRARVQKVDTVNEQIIHLKWRTVT